MRCSHKLVPMKNNKFVHHRCKRQSIIRGLCIIHLSPKGVRNNNA